MLRTRPGSSIQRWIWTKADRTEVLMDTPALRHFRREARKGRSSDGTIGFPLSAQASRRRSYLGEFVIGLLRQLEGCGGYVLLQVGN